MNTRLPLALALLGLLAVSACGTAGCARFADILRIRGFDHDAIAAALHTRREVDRIARGQIDRTAAQGAVDRVSAAPWFQYACISRHQDPDKAAACARDIAIDPFQTVSRIRVPSLYGFGGQDVWIPAEASAGRLRAMGRSSDTVAVIEGAAHAMMTSPGPLEQINPAASARFAPDSDEYLVLRKSWLHDQLHGGRRMRSRPPDLPRYVGAPPRGAA